MGEEDARFFTADYIALRLWRASVYCATCRVWRGFDPLALSVAGKGQTPLSVLSFRCEKCGTAGVMEIDTGLGSYDVKSGQFRAKT